MKIEKQVKDKNLDEIIKDFKLEKQVLKTKDNLFKIEVLKKISKITLNKSKYYNQFQNYFNGAKITKNIATLNITDIKELQEIVNNFYLDNNLITKEHNIFKAVNNFSSNIDNLNDLSKLKEKIDDFLINYNSVKNEEFYDSRLESSSIKWKYKDIFTLKCLNNRFYYLESNYKLSSNMYSFKLLLNKKYPNEVLVYRLDAKEFSDKEECINFYFNQNYIFSLFTSYINDQNFVANNYDHLYGHSDLVF